MKNGNKIKVAFPYELYKSFKKLPINNVFPCSALFNDDLIGGLLLTCSSNDLKHYSITPLSLPQPDLKFRMLNLAQNIYLIEIHLLFDSDKILKLQLDPIHPNVKMLFSLLISKRSISFHFYNEQTDLLASSYTSLGDEEMDWLIRNNKLIDNLKGNKDYQQLVQYISEQTDINDKIFLFNCNKTIEQSFIRKNQKVIKFLH